MVVLEPMVAVTVMIFVYILEIVVMMHVQSVVIVEERLQNYTMKHIMILDSVLMDMAMLLIILH